MYTAGQILDRKGLIDFANWKAVNGGNLIAVSLGGGSYRLDEIVIPVPKPLTDDEIVAKRARLYAQVSDPLFSSYTQGVGTLQDYIDSKAQIGFDNKKSTQTGMTLDDFKHKVSREYQLFKQHNITAESATYRYVESNGIDPIDIGAETITLVRTPIATTVNLPAVKDVQIVKIDNVSEDEIQVVPAQGETVDGASSYVVPAKSTAEFICEVDVKTWDIYTAPLELDTFNGMTVGDLLNGSGKDIKDLEFGMGFKVETKGDKAKVETDLESLGVGDEPPCYYASIADNEALTDNNGDIIHDGIVWYPDVIVAHKTNFFDIDRNNKAIGIQETDNADPNITGGEAYLVVYRSVLSGTADEDGFIESAVKDRDTGEILADANGIPMAVYKGYSKGDKYKEIRIAAIVEAKNLVYLQHHLIDNFATKKTISLQPYTRGNTCILIQGLSKGNRTGKALMKYEQDTGERVLIDYVYDENAGKFVWLLKGFETVDEKQMKFVDDRVILYNPMPKGAISYRFSITNALTKVPFGIVKSGDIPADLSEWDKKEGTDYGNENDLLFVDDCDITVKCNANLHAEKIEPVFLYLTKKEGDKYTEIQGTRVSYTPKAAHEIAAEFPIIKAKVKNGDTIGVAMETTSPAGAYIETDTAKYALITFTIAARAAV